MPKPKNGKAQRKPYNAARAADRIVKGFWMQWLDEQPQIEKQSTRPTLAGHENPCYRSHAYDIYNQHRQALIDCPRWTWHCTIELAFMDKRNFTESGTFEVKAAMGDVLRLINDELLTLRNEAEADNPSAIHYQTIITAKVV